MRDRSGRPKPTEWMALGVAFGALVISGVAFVLQARSDTRAEERASAPLLVPGVEQDARGEMVDVYVGYRHITKRADLLMLETDPVRVVMPMRNAGEGGAILLPDRARPVASCDAADGLPRADKSRLHYYAIRAGESEQLFYNASNKPRLTELYRRLVKGKTTARVVLRYTDTLSRRLRWTCVTYTRGSPDGKIWSVSEARYGDDDFPE